MAQVNINGKVVEDRRQNGARLKLAFSDWWKITGLIVFLIVGGAKIQWDVNRHDKAFADQEKQEEKQDKKVDETKKDVAKTQQDVAVITVNVKAIQKDVTEIKDGMKEQRVVTDKINQNLLLLIQRRDG